MGFYFHLAISLERQLRKIKICQVTFSRKKKKLEKPTNKLRHVLKVDFSLKNVQQPG